MKNNTILLILNPKTPKKSRGGYSHISNLKSIAVIAMMLLSFGIGNVWGAACGEFLSDDTGSGYAGKYKILCPFGGTNIVSVQRPWGTIGIYVIFSGDVTECSLGEGNYEARGGGLLMNITNFEAENTEVTVTAGGNNYTFTVYHEGGTPGGGGGGGEESSSEGNFDCSGHTFYFANNYWHYTGYLYAHMYKSGGASTTFPGTQMTQVSGTAGIYSVTYDADYNTVIFNNGYSNTQLGAKTIEDCKYYDNGGNSHSNLTDVARHIYFVRNGNAASWSPYAHVFYDSRNNGSPGAQMVDLSLTNIDEHNLYSIIVPINNNVIFHNSSDYTKQSATQNISSSFKDYSIFNYADDKWYQTRNIYLTGSMNTWDDDGEDYKFSDWDDTKSTYVTLLTPSLSAGTTYSFKLVTDGTWRTANASPARTYTTDGTTRKFDETGGSDNNSSLTTDVEGRYYFKYDVSAGKLTITYPPSMTSASLASKTYNTATITVASTRGTKYKVTNSDGSVEYTVSNGGAPTDGKITVTGLSANTQYSFKVYALDDNDTESANYSSVISFYTLANMGLASFSSSTCNSITLNVSSTGGVKYTVKSTNGETTYLDKGTPAYGKITVSGLSVGTAYDFYVYAVNSADELSTNYASVSSVSTTSAPATPSSISINTRTYNSITLNVTSANSTKFEYSTNAGENWKTINTTGTIEITELSSESTALSPNTSYTFLIRGKNDCGDVSDGNAEFIAKTTPQMTSASLFSKTHNSVVLSVSSNGGATYKVTNTAGDVIYTVSNSGAPTDGKITVTGLSEFTTYTFRVYAMSSDGTPIQSSNYVDVSNERTYSAGPAAAPSHVSPSCEVFGVYGTQHTNKGMTHGAWGAASSAETVTVDSKSMIHVNTHQASYFGMEYGTKSSDVVNVSGYTKMHLEIWTPASYTFNVCLIYGDGTEATKTSITTNAGSWTSYEYSLSSWETTYQIKFDNINYSEDVEIWFAQAYFYKTDAPCTAPSNPTTSECQTIALYGTQYTAKGWRYGAWQGIGSGADDTQAGQTMFKVATDGANYFGLEYGTWNSDVVDVHHLEKFHIDVWTPTAQTFNICLIYNNGTEYGKKQVTTSAAFWTSIEIDLSSSLTDTYQIKFDGVSTTAFNMWVANAYFYTDDVCESEKCHGSGSEGSGLTINGATVFDSGESYWTKAYMKNDRLHIDAKFIPASNAAAAAYVQFIKSDGEVLEFAMTNKTDSFSVDIIPSNVTAEYRYDGIARYSVKFAITGGIRLTDYQYYDFAHSGCSDYFDIYHADAPAGGRTSFEGGFILQPIRYFRHFPNTDWTTITLPFEVTKVTVKEGEDEYDLYPRFNDGSSDVEGYYWLKTLSGEVAISKFKDSWEELMVSTPGSTDSERAANVKPAKNTPYIIAFPNGDYYSANWVIFYGAACQTISSTFDGTSSIILSGEDYDYNKVQFVGNNTMKESSELKNIYMLEEGEDYFSRRESATVPAFEAYVKGTSQIQKSYVALRYRGGSSTPETPTDIDVLPTTECRGAIYNLSGMQMATFADRNAMEEVLNSLRAGVYIVHIGKEVNKVIVH